MADTLKSGVGHGNVLNGYGVMARRMTKAESGLILLFLIVIVASIALGGKLSEKLGWYLPVLIGGMVAVALVIRVAAKRRRMRHLLSKYQDPLIVERIISKIIWVGETCGQLADSIGNPVDMDEKLLKTKRKSIWKYAHKAGNRYGLRVTVEDGIVVGWDEKL